MSGSPLKIVLTLISILGIGAKASGQAALVLLIFGNKLAREDLYMSMDVGLNISTISNLDGDLGLGANFGLGIHKRLSDKFFLVPEFKALSGKGMRNVPLLTAIPDEINTDQLENTRVSLALNYLELPVLLQYRINSKFYVSGGVQASWLTKASHRTELEYKNGDNLNYRQDIKNDLQRFDWSLPVEVGYVIFPPNNSKGMDLRLRYTHGFMNIFDEATGRTARNSSLQIIATFPFVYDEE